MTIGPDEAARLRDEQRQLGRQYREATDPGDRARAYFQHRNLALWARQELARGHGPEVDAILREVADGPIEAAPGR